MILNATARAAYAEISHKSHAVILRHQNANGAYPAAPSFSAYAGYSWLRDGAFIGEGVSRYGDVESASRFHGWVSTRLAERREQVDGLVRRTARGEPLTQGDMLPTRFAIEAEAGPDEWWNFQTDGYGTWLWAVIEHARRHGLDLEPWRAGLEVAVDYTVAFWDAPCYDWWEENVTERHGSTLAALYGGLSAVARSGALGAERTERAALTSMAIRDLVTEKGLAGQPPYLSKWLGSAEVDASLAAAVVPFGLFAPSSAIAVRTLDKVRADLDLDGGVHRYRADEFFGGGQWLLLSCLVGWNEHAAGDDEAALRRLAWVAAQLTEEGEFPEQVPDHLLNPDRRDHWIGKWGPVATPLLWSHGMYLILADELGVAD